MTTSVNLTIYDGFLTPRTLLTSNIDVNVDNSDIFMNAQIVSNATNIDTNGPYDGIVDNYLVFKNFIVNSYIALNTNSSLIQISAVPDTTVVIDAIGNIFNDTVGSMLVFKNILAGNAISFAENASTLMINASSAPITSATNLGGNTNGLFLSTLSLVLLFKNLTNGSFISLTSNNSIISINAVATTTTIVTGATNIAGNSNGLFIDIGSNGIMNFKTLLGGTFVGTVTNNSTVRINLNSGMVNIIGATNVVVGTAGPFQARAANGTLTFRRLVAANTFITLSNNDSLITIGYAPRSLQYITNATNLGGNTNGLFLEKTGNTLNFKTIKAGSFINILNNSIFVGLNSATAGNSTGGSGIIAQNMTTASLTSSFVFSTISVSNPAIGINVFNNITSNFADRFKSAFISSITTTGFSVSTQMRTTMYAIVDSPSSYTSMKRLSNRNLAIAYISGGSLKFAYNTVLDTSGLWQISEVDTVGQFASLAISINNKPMIAYYDNSNGDLKFAYNVRNNGAGLWTTTTIDSTGIVGQYASLAVMADGFPAVAYYDLTNDDLKFARNNAVDGSGTWTITTVGNGGQYVSLVALATNVPGVVYYDAANNLTFARNAAADGSGVWTTSIIDNGGEYTSLVVLLSGFPAVAYYDITLKYAVNDAVDGSGTWTITSVDSIGQYISLNVLSDGSPGIAYYDGASLKFARLGSSWTVETVDQATGQYVSLGTTFYGEVAISYCAPELKFAKSYSKTSFPSNTATYALMWLKK